MLLKLTIIMWLHKKPTFLLEAQGTFPPAAICSFSPDLLELFSRGTL